MPRLIQVRFPSVRRVVRLFLLAFSALLTSSAMWAGQSDPAPLKLEYTGRLFGYYRVEADQDPAAANGFVKSFLDSRKDVASRPLLLGMGDNFAPEFGASIQQEFNGLQSNTNGAQFCHDAQAELPDSPEEDSDWKKLPPESLYKSDSRLPKIADCDNVVRFLMAAGYNAIVPGREDFIYSAAWLRRIALLLRGASRDEGSGANPFATNSTSSSWAIGPIQNGDTKLHMLAANLRVKISTTQTGKDGKKSTLNSCPLFFTKDLSVRTVCATGTDAIPQTMDWLRRLDLTLPNTESEREPNRVEQSLQLQADRDRQFRRQLLVNQVDIVLSLLNGYAYKDVPEEVTKFSKAELKPVNDTRTENEEEDKTHEKEAGEALNGYAKEIDDREKPGCDDPAVKASDRCKFVYLIRSLANTLQPPDPAHPQLVLSHTARTEARRLFLRLIAREQKNAGYTIAQEPGGRRVLLIGVVGKETMKEVSSNEFEVRLKTAGACELKEPVGPCEDRKIPSKAFPLIVGEPQFAVTTLLRAAWQACEDAPDDKDRFDSVVVMAQMPRSEADELSAHLAMDLRDLNFGTDAHCPHNIDLVLSEAQDGHQTGNLRLSFEDPERAPVFTPLDASRRLYDKKRDHWYTNPNPVSTAYVHAKRQPGCCELSWIYSNSIQAPDGDLAGEQNPRRVTAGSLLLDQVRQYRPESWVVQTWDTCSPSPTCKETLLMRFLLGALQRASGNDAVLLKRRDFWFDSLPRGYTDYEICDQWFKDHSGWKEKGDPYCKLRVALDRVLWRGDFSVSVTVDGKTLTSLLQKAQSTTDLEQTLLASDLHQEWLETFGIVTQPPTRLADAASGPETFNVPGNAGCSAQTAGETPYCIDGLNIAADHAYSITTSKQLAYDKITYTDLGTLTKNDPNTVTDPKMFLATQIAQTIRNKNKYPDASPSQNDLSSAEKTIAALEMRHQNRTLLQVDISKLVGGFTATSPNLSDATVGSDFAGVTNTQALTPHSQELDFESANRIIYSPLMGDVSSIRSPANFMLGVQNTLEFDRKVAGNVNALPETVTYPANGLTVGPFLQYQVLSTHIPGLEPRGIQMSTRNLPRLSVVVAPFQFQRQVVGTYVAFPFYTPAASGVPGRGTFSNTQYKNIQLPTAMGFSQRLGLRGDFSKKWYFDPGSYAEFGPEYLVLNNVLYQLSLPDLQAPNVCTAQAGKSFVSCVKGLYSNADPQVALNADSRIIAVPKTLHAGGLYWMAHLQKAVGKSKTSISFDTSGDDYLAPGFTLPTATRYALTTKLAFNVKPFPSIANFTLSPTYSNFFFANQAPPAQRSSVIDRGFTIAAKWYFARDAEVAWGHQFRYAGPASVDQTAAARVK